MSTDVGRGILAPRSGANIRDGAAEMRTLGATAAAAINTVDLQVSAELAQKIGKSEAYENLVPRDEAVQYGIPGPRGLVGPPSEVPGPPGPGGSIALEETDPGCFVDSEITWLQWDTSVGTVARAWNPNTQTYHMIHYDSGWRDITELVPGVTGGNVNLRRINQNVTIVFAELTVADPGSSWLQLDSFLPAGWRPDLPGFTYVPTAARNQNYSSGPVRVASSGQLVIYDARGKTIAYMATWPCEETLPTSLPGT